MKDKTIIKTGIIGSTITAICCLTPVLVVVLGGLGLTAWLAWLDYVLFPVLAVFVGLLVFGLWNRQRAVACHETDEQLTSQGS